MPILLDLFPLDGKFIFILDGTNGKWGKKDIYTLMLSIAYFGIGIPLFWMVLEGSVFSSIKNGYALLENALKSFSLEKIEILIADREFIGEEWFLCLNKLKISFIIRLKTVLQSLWSAVQLCSAY